MTKRRWITGILWLLITGALVWWTTSLWPTWNRRLMHFAAVMAILCAAAYLPDVLSPRWRIVCFVLALGLAVIAFRTKQSFYFPILIGAMVNFVMPRRQKSDMTMRQAWRFLRTSKQREEEGAKTIIAQHLRDTSQGPAS